LHAPGTGLRVPGPCRAAESGAAPAGARGRARGRTEGCVRASRRAGAGPRRWGVQTEQGLAGRAGGWGGATPREAGCEGRWLTRGPRVPAGSGRAGGGSGRGGWRSVRGRAGGGSGQGARGGGEPARGRTREGGRGRGEGKRGGAHLEARQSATTANRNPT
jgi:translation initiation factor IF-2